MNQRLGALVRVQTLDHLRASDPRFTDPKHLLVHGAQYWSQNLEDGMIAEIFRRISPVDRTFLEIGVENGSETNTTTLLARGWSGWWIEGNPASCRNIRDSLDGMPETKKRLRLREAFVSPRNIAGLLAELGVPGEVDLFSLDIDLDTYHIWNALENFRPRVIVVEYNASLPPDLEWIAPWKEGRTWDGTRLFGASLKAYENLGVRRGYSLVGCDLTGVNAFFVRNDLVGDLFAAPFTAEHHYQPPRYHLTQSSGHPAILFGESHRPQSQLQS
ncbi:MAG TPA: hypothetical protein VIM58_09560 [Candidatus Methylacidiphilales bacterium]